MENLARAMNEYLFFEFGVEGDESLISETWPFKLRPLLLEPGAAVFEFEDDEPYFAIAAKSFNFMPKAGMTFDDLLLQQSGSQWIAAREPIGLETSMPGDASVPSGLDRRKALESLGERALDVTDVQVLEGLFLRVERRYLGLFSRPGEEDAFVVGLSSTPMLVKFAKASTSRRLAWGVGASLKRGSG